jgi:hypothetical protein
MISVPFSLLIFLLHFQLVDDRMALVGDNDVELGIASSRNSSLPPEWFVQNCFYLLFT